MDEPSRLSGVAISNPGTTGRWVPEAVARRELELAQEALAQVGPPYTERMQRICDEAVQRLANVLAS